MTREAVRRQVCAASNPCVEDIADAISYILTRDRRVRVKEMLIRAGDRTW